MDCQQEGREKAANAASTVEGQSTPLFLVGLVGYGRGSEREMAKNQLHWGEQGSKIYTAEMKVVLLSENGRRTRWFLTTKGRGNTREVTPSVWK